LDEDVVMAPELAPVALLDEVDESEFEDDIDAFEDDIESIEAEVVELERAAI
jgi:hypothetical protein